MGKTLIEETLSTQFENTGMFEDVPEPYYHAIPFCSQSRLKLLGRRSPAHMKYALDNPEDSGTKPKIFGNALHCGVLTPDVFHSKFTVGGRCEATVKSSGKRCGNDGKIRTGGSTWLCGVHGKTAVPDNIEVLPLTDFEAVQNISDAVRAHPAASVLLEGYHEMTAIFDHPHNGVRCKARFDVLPEDGFFIADIKTTVDASRIAFERSAYNFGYYNQAAFYIDAAREHEINAEFYTIIAAEKEPPWAVAVYHIRDEAIDAGRKELLPLLEKWAECEKNDHWPGYSDEAIDITLPPYAWKQLQARAEAA